VEDTRNGKNPYSAWKETCFAAAAKSKNLFPTSQPVKRHKSVGIFRRPT
jgi:hypothetical protein